MLNHESSLPRARKEGLVVRELPNEVLVYDLGRDKAHCLNSTSALVWKHCDGQTDLKEIARLLEDECGTPLSEDVVWLALRQLQRIHLLEERVMRPNGAARTSRRQMMRHMSVAALLLPAIISITAPTAWAQGSCAGIGQNCEAAPCCPGSICYQGSCCEGLAPGVQCTSSAQCCSGLCSQGFCA
ncbi:MAG TPA: PqqD family peptide modification chaperone [Pyrinomonadaceae bacterium]|jgi:hypothetical protein|nr:PqqD family peptide modification chaperone [Pyrinomonadaceae bacterium]